jgi:TatD DNase family protein
MSKPLYFDIHSHLNFTAYDPDREEVIKRAEDAGVGMITVGTQMDTSKKAIELAETHEYMYAAIGLHPIHTSKSHHDAKELGKGGKEFTSKGEIPDLDAYRKLASHPKTVAIGECGLDYYRLDEESRALQVKIFESMIDIANEANKPLMLHIRNGDPAGSSLGSNRSAYADAFEILKSRANVKGNLHFFAGTIEEAKLFLDLGYTFSFTGVLTFTHDYDEIVKYLPLDRIMSETDCPYITPVPHRGKRNEPSFVIEVVKAIARIRNKDVGETAVQLADNARRFIDAKPA